MSNTLIHTKTVQSADYRLLGLVGQGQFAQVYCAIHRRTGQLVAIKQIRHNAESTSQEAFILPELKHPNLVCCQSIAQTETGYEFILDYCEGGTLRAAIGEQSKFSLPKIKSLMTDILLGLSYLHDHAIIHGDLKPENILLTHPPHKTAFTSSGPPPFPTAKVADFGSACFVQSPNHSRREIGSPTYAAPERFNGQSSCAADLYSVGVMLYEMLLGDRPFSGSPDTLRDAHQTQPVPLPASLTPAAYQLLSKALSKAPERRFPSAAALISALQALSGVHNASNFTPAVISVPKAVVELDLLGVCAIAKVPFPVTQLIPIHLGHHPSSSPNIAVITAKSYHLLTEAMQLLPVAQFSQNSWVALDPQGRWFAAFAQRSAGQRKGQDQGLFYRLSAAGATAGHPIRLASTLMTALQSKVIQILAINARYLLRVRTSGPLAKTVLECFTRRGQFVGQLSFNLPIAEIALTPVPYQLIARTATADSSLILIGLKPFQIQTFPHYSRLQSIVALSWGYLLIRQHQALLLDRCVNLIRVIEGLPADSAIASLTQDQLLIASPHRSKQSPTQPRKQPQSNGPSVEKTSTNGPSSLSVIDLKPLDLDIIF